MFNPRAPSSMLDGSLNVAVSPFELIAIKRNFASGHPPDWNSLLSCNSINTPSTLTMGSQGSVCGWPVGAMQGKMAVLGSQALRLQRFNLTMAARSSQALHLPRFNF